MTSSRLFASNRYGIAAATAALLLLPLLASAATITGSELAEIPLQGLNPVKPNIMLTVDDSGSMLWDFLPDYTAWAGTGITHCRDGGFQCGGGNLGMTFLFNGFTAPQNDPPIRSSTQNKQYYDPTATYVPGKTIDGIDLPAESTSAAPGTSVYVSGFAGYPGANPGTIANSGAINLTTGYPDTAWCNSQAASPPSALDLATAYTDGSKCRLNGRAYPRYTEPSNLWTAPSVAAGYNYPNVTNVATGAGTACGSPNEYCVFNFKGTVYGSPYYYTISKIQFCSNKDAAGFGIAPCQDRYDASTYKYIRYGNDPTMAFDPRAFTRVDVKSSGFLVNGAAAANPSGRSYAAEMANFARWYAFYRTRILSMKTATGIAFSALSDENARVGLHTLRFGWNGSTYIPNGNTSGNAFLNVTDFNPANKATWFTAMYGINVNFGTPLPDALYRIGEYFSNSGNSGLPGAVDPLDATTGMCQPNYHLLSTDGYWNYGLQTGNAIGDKDLNVPALPVPVAGLTAGSQFPRPYYEGPTITSNSLADLAMYYWARDIRTDKANEVKDTIAPWQHVTLYGLSIGAQGNLPYPSGINDVTSGTKDWPTTQNGSPPGAVLTAGPEAIDDLWHAAINSRGKYFNAANPQQLAESIVSALADFTDQSGTGTAVGIAGAQFTSTQRYGYRTSYEGGLWGDVKKYALDSNTGALPVDSAGNPVNPPLWSAATRLDAQALGTGWDTNRRILTINDSTGVAVPFRLANLSPSQKDSVDAGWTAASPGSTTQAVLNFLRGDQSNEGVGLANFRVRAHVLGEIVYSAAVAVGAPNQPYVDTGNPGYENFKTLKATRTPMVYVGGNDAMVHVFDDSTGADAGKETWAFIPRAMFSRGDPNDTAHALSAKYQLGTLSYRRGGSNPGQFALNSRFYVNFTPRTWDIDFANTNTSTPPDSGNDWRTVLVGALGAGGRSIYALDITTPVASSDTETTIASSGRVLWEKTASDAGFQDLGYVFDAPTLVKTFRYGWVVLVASGYNNQSGKGILYVLNPTDGTILKTLSPDNAADRDPNSAAPTETISATNPRGLSTIRAYTASRRDPYVLQAYGGDLHGNVWRFDLSDPDESKWKVALIAKLTDKDSNAPQPITTGIRVEIDQNNNVDRYLFVGTGKLLSKGDISSATIRNTLYVIRDGTRTAAEAAPATPYTRANLNAVVGSGPAGFSDTATGRGWFQDAALLTEKIGTDVYADVQTVVYSFDRPNIGDPCAAPLSSTLYARDLNTGSSVLQLTEGGDPVASIDVSAGIAGIRLIQGEGGAAGASSGDIRVQVTTMKGQVFSFGIKLSGGLTLKHRVSWRLLNRD